MYCENKMAVFLALQALAGESPVVAYEVTLSLQRLVTKYGKDIQPVTWDIILTIILQLFDNIQVSKIVIKS